MSLGPMDLDGVKYYMEVTRRTAEGSGDGQDASWLGIFVLIVDHAVLNDGKTSLRHGYVVPVQHAGSNGRMLCVSCMVGLPPASTVGYGLPRQVTDWLKEPRLLYDRRGKQCITIGVQLMHVSP